MRKVIQRAFGGPEVFEFVECADPRPGPAEVLVRVRAAGVNRIDAAVRGGVDPLLGRPPFTVGWAVAGVVRRVGPGAARFREGEAVFGLVRFPRAAEAYADYVLAPSRQLAAMPLGWSFAEAAVLAMAGLTAWQGLVEVAGLAAGQVVLVRGADNAEGHLALQVARAYGAAVLATADEASIGFVRALGVNEVVPETRAGLCRIPPKGMDIVFDALGARRAPGSLAALRTGGILLAPVDWRDGELAERVRRAGGRWGGFCVEPDHVGLETLVVLAETGRLRAVVRHEVPFAEVALAHELLEAGPARGGIVLVL